MQTKRASALLAGLAAGSALMYLVDPRSGRTRRALLRDKAVRTLNLAKDTGDEAVRDLRNRTRGVASELWYSLKREPVSDEVLVERVRAKLGRLIFHPHAIAVTSRNGIVKLRGRILEHEVEHLISAVHSIRGVFGVETELEPHKEPGDIPDLQGGRGVREAVPDILQENWAPATRALMSSAALAAIALGSKRRLLGPALVLGGSTILLRALLNQPIRRVLGLDSRRGIEFQKTMEIHAPVDQVFQLCSNPENFPRIMSHVREVKRSDGAFRWVVGGPAGLSVSWNAVLTETIPNRVIAWKSVPGAIVRNAGLVRFDPTPEGGTRIQLRMSYNPVGGVIAHALATLLGANPKRVLDEDFIQLKSLFEEGKTTAHGRTVTREELSA